jgi:hypothetical protein
MRPVRISYSYHQSQGSAGNHHAEPRDHNEGENTSNHPVLPSINKHNKEKKFNNVIAPLKKSEELGTRKLCVRSHDKENCYASYRLLDYEILMGLVNIYITLH